MKATKTTDETVPVSQNDGANTSGFEAMPNKRKLECIEAVIEATDKGYFEIDELVEALATLAKGNAEEAREWDECRVSEAEWRSRELRQLVHRMQGWRRSAEEIRKAEEKLFDQIWYDRQTRSGLDATHIGQKAVTRIEQKYPASELGPWDDFEWGMINGKLSSLRWVLGHEWDMLDT
jgi:hypothetical protein